MMYVFLLSDTSLVKHCLQPREGTQVPPAQVALGTQGALPGQAMASLQFEQEKYLENCIVLINSDKFLNAHAYIWTGVCMTILESTELRQNMSQ